MPEYTGQIPKNRQMTPDESTVRVPAMPACYYRGMEAQAARSG